MSSQWRTWFGMLAGTAVIGAIVMVTNASNAADLNNSAAAGAPQQTVVSLWHLADLAAAIVFELVVLTAAVISLALYLGTRDSTPPTVALPEPETLT